MAAGDGLVSMKPTSIAHSGTSASINADGGVDFTAVTSLSLNGVFTSEMDNYLILLFGLGTADTGTNFRLRVAGTDADGSSDYVYQYLLATGSATPSGARDSAQTFGRIGNLMTTQRSGITVHMYGPALAQATAWRSVTVDGLSSARIQDFANTHDLATAYDGFTIYPNSGNFTGNIHVFGYEE